RGMARSGWVRVRLIEGSKSDARNEAGIRAKRRTAIVEIELVVEAAAAAHERREQRRPVCRGTGAGRVADGRLRRGYPVRAQLEASVDGGQLIDAGAAGPAAGEDAESRLAAEVSKHAHR